MQENTDATTPTATAVAPRTDRLEVVKELGRGSIGVVRKARNPQQDRFLALRQFDVPEWLDDVNDLLKKILTEARAASALDHPNVAKLFTCGYKDFTVFMTAEFVDGQTLRELMSSRQPEMNEVLSLARQLCAALDYAHDKGVFHNFLNPNNIKVLVNGNLKVLDFGLLRQKDLLTQTPIKKLENEPYLSPEQVKQKPVDRAANLFTVAAIVYELYTARSPFAGKHLGEIDRSITDVMPHPLNVAHPRVPESISRVVLKGLSKDPGDRHKTGQAFIDALEQAAKDAPVRPATGKSDPNSSQSLRVTPQGPPSQSFKVSPQGPPSQSFKVQQGPSSQVIRAQQGPPIQQMNPAGAARTASFATSSREAAASTTARATVSNNNQWKLVGAVVICLAVVAGLAFIFQRKPSEDLPETPAAKSSAPGKSAQAPFSRHPAAPVKEVQEESTAVAQPRVAQHNHSRKVESAPAAAAPAEGQVVVSSVPMGARVEIEGVQGQWKTPQTIAPLPAGTYKVTVSQPGYAPEIRSLTVTANNRANLDLRLTPVKGWITVGGSPAGSSVVINGKDTGRVTPAEFMLDPAVQSIVVRKAGYLEAGTEIKLAAGQAVNYAPTLMVAGRTDNMRLVGGGMGKVFGGNGNSQGMARVEIKTDPKGAQVIINGTALQKPTPVEVQLEAGNYDITIQKDGYKPLHENAIVGPDDHVKINRSLSH